MQFSRTDPSPRYRDLIELYRQMHLRGENFLGTSAEETFSGESLRAQALRIKRLIEATGAHTILDYGCGKGKQYDPRPVRVENVGSFDSIMDYWDVDSVACYDPAYPPYSKLPEGRFDGVVCTDVMEHCPEEDVPWIVGEIFGYAERFVYVNATCFPASKRLPNGENAHCTIRPPDWWEAIFRRTAAGHPGVTWQLWVAFQPEGSPKAYEKLIGGPAG